MKKYVIILVESLFLLIQCLASRGVIYNKLYLNLLKGKNIYIDFVSDYTSKNWSCLLGVVGIILFFVGLKTRKEDEFKENDGTVKIFSVIYLLFCVLVLL